MAKKEDIRGLLAEQFEGFGAEPDVDLWPEIEAKLHPGKKRRIVWLTAITIAASIAMLFAVIQLLNDPVEPQVPFTDVQMPTENLDNQASLPTDELLTDDLVGDRVEEDKEDTIKEEETDRKTETILNRSERSSVTPSVAELEPKNEGRPGPEILPEQTTIVEHIETAPQQPELEKIQLPAPTKEITLAEQHIDASEKTENLLAEAQTPASQGRNNRLDLSDLTLKNFVSFTTNELSKIDKSPIDVYQQEGEDGETKVVQFDLFNLSFTHKSHKRRAKKL